MKIRCRALVVTSALACANVPAAHAQGADAKEFSGPGCAAGVFAFLAADPKAVRAEGRIPDRWKLAVDSAGKSVLFMDMALCQMTLGGRTRTVVYTNLAAQLDSTALPSPERQRSTSNVAGGPADFYLLSWAANDNDFVRFMQTDTGLGDVARLVLGLTFRVPSGAVSQFAFNASEPSHSPFQFAATLMQPFIPVYPVEVNFWRETPVGSFMLDTSHELPYPFGLFKQWTLKTDPTSPLGRMLGGEKQDRTCTAARLPAPLLTLVTGSPDAGCLGVNTPSGRMTFRKHLPAGGRTSAQDEAATKKKAKQKTKRCKKRAKRAKKCRRRGRP